MATPLDNRLWLAGLAVSLLSAPPLWADPAAGKSAPTAAQALGIKPVQKDVEYDQPAADEFAKCTIAAQKIDGHTGWVVRNAKGLVLRNFVDTDADNKVDQWCYFKDGVEVYRDIDSNHNGKADQCRWLNSGGTRWGSDKNEDKAIDSWEVISPEEVSSELVGAVRDRDRQRFERLLVSSQELKDLGLGSARLEETQKRVAAALSGFEQFARSQKVITAQSNWVYFGGGRPGTVPRGTDESTADITVYENVAAMVETDGKTGQLPIANLVKIGNTWKLLDLPTETSGPVIALGPAGTKSGPGPQTPDSGAPSEKVQKLLDELAKLDQLPNPSPDQIKRKCDLLEELAVEVTSAEDRALWFRQLADTLSAATQIGTYPDGLERLASLGEKLADEEDKDLKAYVKFRLMTAAYNVELSKPDVNYAAVQAKWLADLEEFVRENPNSPDSAEAMLQLAMGQEFQGDDKNAVKWYRRVIDSFPKTATAYKAEGAVRRLESVGRTITIKGKSLGNHDVSLAALKGKVVLIHYWSSDINACLIDLPAIEKMVGKYEGFTVIGVSLDNERKVVENYLRGNPLPWPNIWEEGGLSNRLANEMGILTLPTMILVDKDGKVVNRSIHAIDLDNELKNMLKPRLAKRPDKQ